MNRYVNDLVVLDLGNYNIKYKGEGMGLFSSKYHTNFEPNPEAFERVEYNGAITYIGVGELEREFNKASKNVLPQILYAIDKATKSNDINLGLLLPIEQIGNRDKLINSLQNKSFTYRVNSKSKTVNINKVMVLPEGQVAFRSLENPSPYTIYNDIGSRTWNWVAYEEGKPVKNGTEKIGTFDLYSRIKTKENSHGEDYKEEDIELQIKRGRIKVELNTYKDFLKDGLNLIKAKVNIKNYDPVFGGGGAVVLKDILDNVPTFTTHPNPVYANVLGAYNIIKAMLK